MAKEYNEALAALERKEADDKILKSLLDTLADSSGGINTEDEFGLTISMRAAAHGRLDVIKAACDRKASIEKRNSLTRANLLHYAAQQPVRGADIIRWAILEEKASDDLLKERIYVSGEDRDEDKDWDRGNGHTVAFEAVFNKNVEVVKVLLDIEKQGYKVAFEKPAMHGWKPLGWALNNMDGDKVEKDIVDLLMSKVYPNLTTDDALIWEKEDMTWYFEDKDEDWKLIHPRDVHALKLADELRLYIIHGSQGASVGVLLNRAFKKGVKPNEPYGRFGQPLLNLIPTHPDIMGIKPSEDQKDRYTEVVRMLIDRGANPMIKEKGLMEVSAGFREVFFDYIDALKLIIEKADVAEQGMFNGYTRLIDAMLIGRTDAIKLLLAHPANSRIESIRGFNGWMYQG